MFTYGSVPPWHATVQSCPMDFPLLEPGWIWVTSGGRSACKLFRAILHIKWHHELTCSTIRGGFGLHVSPYHHREGQKDSDKMLLSLLQCLSTKMCQQKTRQSEPTLWINDDSTSDAPCYVLAWVTIYVIDAVVTDDMPWIWAFLDLIALDSSKSTELWDVNTCLYAYISAVVGLVKG